MFCKAAWKAYNYINFNMTSEGIATLLAIDTGRTTVHKHKKQVGIQ